MFYVCLGSPSVIWPISQLDRSFVPLPFDRFTFSLLFYEPRQPVHHVAGWPFRSWLCVPAFQQVCHFCAVFIIWTPPQSNLNSTFILYAKDNAALLLLLR
jgi:hypothetical protein